MMDSYETYIGTIYADINSIKFMVFSTKTYKLMASHEMSVQNICEKDGWNEQDPMEILFKINKTINVTCEKLKYMNISLSSIVTIGITSQRDTAVFWDRTTGMPFCNSLSCIDSRASHIYDRFINNTAPFFDSINEKIKFLQSKCGLIANSHFSVFKLLWLIENVPDVRSSIMDRRCMFGTIDSWIIWNLTGGQNGGVHIMDVTSASRTMLMNIRSLIWDTSMFDCFEIPRGIILPSITSCSEVYGYFCDGALKGKPISGCIVDHQASNVGQMCFVAGQAKSTIKWGCFVSYNTGRKAVISKNTLLTTVAYKMGKFADPVYSLEGYVAMSPHILDSLFRSLCFEEKYSRKTNTENIIQDRLNNVRVPAFSGLFTPRMKRNGNGARLPIDTLDPQSTKSSLQAICFRTKSILKLMELDTGHPVLALNVDGELSTCDTLLQSMTNICGVPVVRTNIAETTAFGAAIAAGLAFGVWRMHTISIPSETFLPAAVTSERKYDESVARNIHCNSDNDEDEDDVFEKL